MTDPRANGPVIIARGLRKSFRGQAKANIQALDNVSFKAARGP